MSRGRNPQIYVLFGCASESISRLLPGGAGARGVAQPTNKNRAAPEYTNTQKYGIYLCENCRSLVNRYGYPTTLGDLSGLVMLAARKFGTSRRTRSLSL